MRSGRVPTWARFVLAALWVGFVSANASAQESGEVSESPPVEEAAAEEEEVSETGDFGRELRTVEEQVNTLKERVFRSKATLQLLKELITEGATMGARLNLWHVNQMGGAYRIEAVQYFLNGKNVFSKADPSGTLHETKEMKVHEQALPPGKHNVQVQLVLRGQGYGIFSYLQDYQFRVQSSYGFAIEDGTRTNLRAVAVSKGFLKSFESRPDVRFEPRVEYLRE
jgi:hypothetical protein